MARSVVVKKEEKVMNLFMEHGTDISESQFIEIFKNDYPKEWTRINEVYIEEKRKTKPGKSHPMPEPTKYLSNMYKVYKKKIEKRACK